MISYKEALDLLRTEFKPVITNISVPLEDSVGYVLSEDIFPDINLPPFDNSAMDGYAIKYNPEIRKWRLIGQLTAGSESEFTIDESTTVSIMTGAKLPIGADTIIPVENAELQNDIVILNDNAHVEFGEHIREMGNDLPIGILAVKSGTLIETKHIPILAACGQRKVKVKKPLRIAVISTGDELVDIDNKPENAQIRATNLYSIISLIKDCGIKPINFGLIKDDKQSIANTFRKILESKAEVIITTGGVSVGQHDYLKDVLKELGAKTIFWRVNIKPGKPFLFSIIEQDGIKKYIFGLPGNPLSSFVNFNIFIKPSIKYIYGKASEFHFTAEIVEDLNKKDNKLHFIMGYYEYVFALDRYFVRKAGTQSSGNMYTLSQSNCMVMFPEELTEIKSGSIVDCIRI
ncbi:MAG: Molybdopterin molybdenumtransferase [Ignavibacteria bacterium]|nr:Molybdopterin molybdenumtransferase [Ignavibacteria bacterium]